MPPTYTTADNPSRREVLKTTGTAAGAFLFGGSLVGAAEAQGGGGTAFFVQGMYHKNEPWTFISEPSESFSYSHNCRSRYPPTQEEESVVEIGARYEEGDEFQGTFSLWVPEPKLQQLDLDEYYVFHSRKKCRDDDFYLVSIGPATS